MAQLFRVGFVGAGYVSPFHVLALQRLPQVRLVGVADLDLARARALAEPARARAFGSVAELLAAGVDVVHVLTPPASHAAVTIQALAHGCHVLVEKPLATSLAECDQIAAAADKAGKVVGVNHSLLRDPFVVRAIQAVRAGAIGEVLSVDYFRSSEYAPWRGGPVPPQYRAGGYPFRDLGVHALYLIQELLGDIQDVQATFRSAGRLSRDPNLLYDEWRALVPCARGTGQIQISWNVRPMQHVLLIQGAGGVLRADLFGMNVTLKRNTALPKAIERLTHALGEGRQIQAQVLANAYRFARHRLRPYHGLQTLIAEFYDNLAAGKPAPVTVADARAVVDWTERAAQPADAAKQVFLTRFPTTLTAPVLVTGAAGFIGRHLVQRLLADNQQVRLFVRREPPAAIMNHPRIEVVLGDLGDPDSVDRAVAGTRPVYHVGAAMSGWPEDFERSTVAGTRHVVESVLRHRVARLVYVSSLSVIDWAGHPPAQPVTESAPLEPHADRRGSYTQSKLAAEQIVSAAVRTRGLNAIILRPGQVFGPGAPLLTPAVARRLGRRLVILGDGALVLPLVYVTDIIDALVLAAASDATPGAIFHLVDTAQVTQAQLAARCDPAAPILCVPRPIVDSLAFGVELLGKILKRSVPLTRYRVRSALAPLTFDCTAARNQLGWQPRMGVTRGLEKHTAMNVPLLDLSAQYATIHAETEAAVLQVLRAGRYILGPEVGDLERELAAYLGVKHVVTCASGSDALLLALLALGIGPGDEVITTPFTFFATVSAITRLGAQPVLVDIDPATFNLDPGAVARHVTPRTKAIIPIHLFGQCAELAPLLALGIPIVEDACQAIGAKHHGRMAGALGTIGTFSFYPTKNLGGAGDGGALSTQDDALAAKLRQLRNHGMEPRYHHALVGINSRLDTLQAAVLRVKLPHLDQWTAARRRNAAHYTKRFQDLGIASLISCPQPSTLNSPPAGLHVFNQYTLRVPRRDALRAHLQHRGIGTEIYYPVPLHLQPCFAHLGHRAGDFPQAERAAAEALSLPIYPELSAAQIDYVAATVAEFVTA